MSLKSNKIIVATDFSEQSEIALSQSYNFARLTHSELILVHVIEEVNPVTRMFTTVAVEDIKQKVKDKLEELAKDVKESTGLVTEVRVRQGRPSKKIVELAVEEDARLIVMGVNSKQGKTRFIGSNTSRVVRTAGCPVLTIKGRSHREGCKTMIVPLDLSKDTTQKINHAIRIAKYYDAEVKLMSVISSDEGFEYEALANQMRLEIMKFQREKIPVTAEFVRIMKGVDSIASGVLAFARKYNADLILLMTQQETDLAELFIGSAAQEIIRNSEIPVMSIVPQSTSV